MTRRIRILIPCYNEARILPRSLASYSEQTFAVTDSVEFVLLDDGSTDGTSVVAAKTTSGDQRFRIVRSEMNRGKTAVMSSAFRSEADVDVVISSDADVVFGTTDTLSLIANAVSAGADLVSGNPIPFEPRVPGERGPFFSSLMQTEVKRLMGGDCIWSSHGRLLGYGPRMAEVLRNVEWPPKPIGEDAFVYVEARRNGLSFGWIPEARVFFRSPASFEDYVRQTRRFERDKAALRSRYGSLFDNLVTLPPLIPLRALFGLALRYPEPATRWIIERLASRTAKVDAVAWGTSSTTKDY